MELAATVLAVLSTHSLIKLSTLNTHMVDMDTTCFKQL
jgi:hypothetical protein